MISRHEPEPEEAISLYKQNGFREVTPSEISERVDQAFELKLL